MDSTLAKVGISAQSWSRNVEQESELSPSSSRMEQSGDPTQSSGNQWILEQWRNRRLCDIVIHATIKPEPAGPDPDSQPISAHKMVLGSRSPFFAHVISVSDESLSEFIINGIDRSTLEYLVDYIYTLQMGPLNETSVFMIYIGAEMLLLESVMMECVHYIESTTTPATAVNNWLFGKIHRVELANYSSGYILSNLEQVLETEEFRNLTSDKLLELLRIANNEDLCSAEVMLQATIIWLKHSPQRHQFIGEVMSKIPLNLIDLETLRRWFREDEIIKKIPSCMELYCETIEQILLEQNRKERETISLKFENSFRENPPNNSNGMHKTGRSESEEQSRNDGRADTSSRSYLNSNLNSIENLPQHDPSSICIPDKPSQEIAALRRRTVSMERNSPAKRLKNVSGEEGQKSSFSKTKVLHNPEDLVQNEVPGSSATPDNHSPIPVRSTHAYTRSPIMYFICGDKQSQNREIMFYDFNTKRCEKLTSYPFKHDKSCLVYYRGSIYDIGGRINNKAFIRVKIFDFVTKGWRKTPIPTMAEKRSHFGCVILDDCIYAVGGCDGLYGINCVERLPPRVKDKRWLWEDVDYMQRARNNCGVCVYDGKIYAVGGWVAGSKKIGVQMVYSGLVECYDPVMDSWTSKCSMPTKRLGLAVAVAENLLYAIGGGTTVRAPLIKLNTVEVYDCEKNSWRPRAPMIKPRQFFSAVVIDSDVYAIGGDLDDKPTMEKFDTARNEWTMIGDLIPGGNYHPVAFTNGD